MKNTFCPNGEEVWQIGFKTTKSGKSLCEYDYRTTSGVLFSTVTTSLEVARIKRDNWLKERGLKN